MHAGFRMVTSVLCAVGFLGASPGRIGAQEQAAKPEAPGAAKPARPVNHPDNRLGAGVSVFEKDPVNFDGYLSLADAAGARTWSHGRDKVTLAFRRSEGEGEETRETPLSDLRVLKVTRRDEADPYRWVEGEVVFFADQDEKPVAARFVDFQVKSVTVEDRKAGDVTTFSLKYVRAVTTIILWSAEEPEPDTVAGGASARTSLRVGMRVPVFKAQSLNKGTVDLADSVGKVPLLIVFSPNGTNTSQAPDIDRLQKQYDGRVKIIVIKQTVPMGAIGESWVKGMKVDYPIINDRNSRFQGPVTRLFGVKAVPVVFFTDQEGNIIHIGPTQQKTSTLEAMSGKLAELYGDQK